MTKEGKKMKHCIENLGMFCFIEKTFVQLGENMAVTSFMVKMHATQDRHVREEGNSLYAILGKIFSKLDFFFPSDPNGICGFNTSKFSMGKC